MSPQPSTLNSGCFPQWRSIASGGLGSFRLREGTSSGLLYEVRYPAGVGSPEHYHGHDSIIYLLSWRLRCTVNGGEAVVGPSANRDPSVGHPARR